MIHKLLAADSHLTAKLKLADKPGALRTASIWLAHSGDSPVWLVAFGLMIWLGSPFWRRLAWIDLIGIAATAAVVQLIKVLVRRPRPAGEWGQGYRKLDPHSFPSGHAARASMLAIIALFTGPWWWAVAVALWAPLVSLARVTMGVHYLSDITAGVVIGLACGLGVALLTPNAF